MQIDLVILSVGLLAFLAHFFVALFDKARIPDVLPLLLLGLLVGPFLGWVTPDTFGQVGPIFTTVTLIVILFEGGLGIQFSVLKRSLGQGLGLSLLTFVLTLGLVTLGGMALGFSFLESLLLGSILGGTSPSVVIPLVARLTLRAETKASLLLESTFSDVLCIVVTLGILQAAKQPSPQVGLILGNIVAAFLLAGALGVAGGVGWSLLLKHVRKLENSTFLTPAFVLVLYGLTELLGYSGAIAALCFGVFLGNASNLPLPLLKQWTLEPVKLNEMEKSFFAEAVFLLKTFFFVYIGLSVQLGDGPLLLQSLGLVLCLMLLRIPVVRLALPHQLPRKDAVDASLMVAKGLAAAALASLPLSEGLPFGAHLREVVFAVILFSMVGTAVFLFLAEKTPFGKLYERCFGVFKKAK
ncbi:MAG TPA: cation:proton antiporter [bacterium]|nr:cation:proton antiporter [bacterium]